MSWLVLLAQVADPSADPTGAIAGLREAVEAKRWNAVVGVAISVGLWLADRYDYLQWTPAWLTKRWAACATAALLALSAGLVAGSSWEVIAGAVFMATASAVTNYEFILARFDKPRSPP